MELTPEINLKVTSYHGRPYQVVFTEQVAEQLIAAIEDDKLKQMNLDYISFRQNLEGIDMTDHQELLAKLFR